MKTIIIEDVIGWDVTAQDIREQLKGVENEEIQVNIASPGGLISEGLNIYNLLRNHKGTVNTHLTGVVASMATYIAMVGEKRTAEENAVFMIHNGSAFAIGDHRQMFKVGNHLQALSNIIAKEYTAKTDMDIEDIQAAMDDETYFYGDEIQKAGFVHEMTGSDAGPDPTDLNKDEMLAFAQLAVQECSDKINKPDIIKKDMAALATMLHVEPKQEKIIKDKIKMEEKVMDYKELQEKHPDIFNKIMDEGVEEGITVERTRVKELTDLRAKFSQAHSQKVIDTGITEGEDLTKVSVNLMAAEQAAKELEKEKASSEKIKADPENKKVVQMKDGIMETDEHIDETSKEIAAMLGISA